MQTYVGVLISNGNIKSLLMYTLNSSINIYKFNIILIIIYINYIFNIHVIFNKYGNLNIIYNSLFIKLYFL